MSEITLTQNWTSPPKRQLEQETIGKFLLLSLRRKLLAWARLADFSHVHTCRSKNSNNITSNSFPYNKH